MNYNYVLLFLVLILLTGCTKLEAEVRKSSSKHTSHSDLKEIKTEFKSVSQDELLKIENISVYFSSNRHSTTEFKIIKSDKTIVGTYKEIVTNEDKTDNYVITSYLNEYPSETNESLDIVKNFSISTDEIKLVRQVDNLLGTTTKNLIILNKQKSSWVSQYDLGDRQNFITSTNKTVSTSFGSFSNCIEVTETTMDGKEVTIKTYAPNVGLVHQLVLLDGDIYLEYDLVDYNSGINRKKDNEKQNEFGRLPSIETLSVSNININDYAAVVNELSISQINNQILHRPSVESGKDNDFIYSFSTEIGDIQITTNDKALIKKVKFESDEALGEEGLLYMQWLILSLSLKINLEKANNIIFADPFQFYELDDYLIGLESHNNGFNFVILSNK
ncbi:hypothetical protein FGG79_21045 [Bacillus sp. BHET2]|uniref:hypothetical protein n=1 Tax=Bacillus sp. BHET2 TaxID=2583818 RepID=UPI00110F2489|nr:hypothetical protein [Bacillus sp. BHET2]TMU82176.1 hypothetical protein FGG79_21045 [Bacillus sp. BHET2]